MTTLVDINGTLVPEVYVSVANAPVFPVTLATERVAARVNLSAEERQVMKALGYAEDAAINGPERNNDSGYHPDHLVRDPHTGEYIDTKHRAHPKVVGNSASFAITVTTGTPLTIEVTGRGDRADRGLCIEDKSNSSWPVEFMVGADGLRPQAGHHLRIGCDEYRRKTQIEWYNEVYISRDYASAVIVGCISRVDFQAKRKFINYGHKDNWYVGADQFKPYVATWNGTGVVLFPLDYERDPVTSAITGYGLNQLTHNLPTKA